MDVPAVDPVRSDIDVPVRAAISKRKVASAPAAPAYKGNFQSCGTIWDGYSCSVSFCNQLYPVDGWLAHGALCAPIHIMNCGSVSSQLMVASMYCIQLRLLPRWESRQPKL